MHILELAPEIILAIYQNCSSIGDVTSLSQSCRRMHGVLSASQKIQVLFGAAELQFGPLHDAIQFLTLNNSQPAHLVRHPALSESLLRQIIVVGRVAKRWEDIYPLYKWDSDFADRRSLSSHERYSLRRAVYRYWLYTHAFHNPAYPRTSRRVPQLLCQRVKLLQNWTSRELVEMDDFQATMRTLISSHICPSNSRVEEMRLGDGGYLPAYSVNQPPTAAAQELFHCSRDGYGVKAQASIYMDGPVGWGDAVTHYYIIEDLLKLDPAAILWLYDHPTQSQVESYLQSLGEWFRDNGDTFSETLAWVLKRRDIADDSVGTMP